MATYSIITNSLSVSVAKTIIQIKAGTLRPVEILRAWVTRASGTTSEQLPVQILRKSAAATVTSFTPRKTNTNDPTANAAGGASATGTDASAEGTDGDIIIAEGFNLLSGWVWLPIPEERVFLAPGEFIGLKLPTAPAAAVLISAGFTFAEL